MVCLSEGFVVVVVVEVELRMWKSGGGGPEYKGRQKGVPFDYDTPWPLIG